MTAATQFRQRAADLRVELLDDLIRIEKGEDIAPEIVIDKAKTLGITLPRIAEVAEALHTRHEAYKTFTATDWKQQVETAMQAYRDSAEAVTAANAAAEQAREACREAQQRTEAAMHRRQNATQAKETAEKEFDKLMKSTAAPGVRDYSDWTAVAL